MGNKYVIPHFDFIPHDLVQATKFDDGPIEVHLTGKLAASVRAEGKETGEADIEVVYRHLFNFLDDAKLPRKLPANFLPVRVRVDGNLADALRANATLRGTTPEDRALEILADAFAVPRPATRSARKKNSRSTGLTITVEVPGVMAQALRMRNYPNPISADLIVGILQHRFRDPEDFPILPGMEDWT